MIKNTSKLIALFICMMLITSLVSAADIEYDVPSIRVETKYDELTKKVTIAAKTMPPQSDKMINALVIKPSGLDEPYRLSDITEENAEERLVYAMQGMTNESGTTMFVFKMPQDPTCGYYQVKLSCDGLNAVEDNSSGQFFITTDEEIQKALARVSVATVNELTSCMTSIALSNSFDVANYLKNADFLNNMIVIFRQELPEQKITSIAQLCYVLDLANFWYEIKTGILSVEKLDNYVSEFEYAMQDDYTLYKEQVNSFIKAIQPTEISSIAGLENLYHDAVILATISETNRAQVTAVLVKYANNLALETSDEYKSYLKMGDKQIEINISIARKTFKSITELTNAFKAKVREVQNTLDKGDVGGSVGVVGGGGGGSTISIAPLVKETPKPTEPEKKKEYFSDLKNVSWAADSINFLYEKGAITGSSAGKFSPNEFVTREQFTKILIYTLGLLKTNAETEFEDCKQGEWYYDYVATANKLGIIKGIDDQNFGVGQFLTREQIAVMLNRTAPIVKITLKEAKTAKFDDYNLIADYAKSSVDLLSAAEIISGNDDNKFNPTGYCTRAEVSVLVCRMWNLKEKAGDGN